MTRFIPIIGTVVLVGAFVQLYIGFQVASDLQGLRDVHMAVGIVGLFLILGLTGVAFKAKSGTGYSKITMAVLTVVVLVQVALGFRILSGSEALVASHEAAGFLIVLLALVTGGITFWSSKKQIPQAR